MHNASYSSNKYFGYCLVCHLSRTFFIYELDHQGGGINTIEDGQCQRRARVERNSEAHSRVDRRCRRRAAKEDPTSSERALRNPCTKAIKTEICLSEASSFPFSLGAGILARAGAVLIF